MKSYLKTIQISLLAILAGTGVGLVTVYPIVGKLTSECFYNNYLNDVYDPAQTVSGQINSCLMQPTFFMAAITFVASVLILLLLRSLALREISIRFVAVTALIYAPIQLMSLFFIQSNYLWEAQLANTVPEIVRNYWFTIDPIIYFLIAASIARWVTQNKKSPKGL